MRVLTAASLCVLLVACGTIEPVPNARPLSQSNIEALKSTKLSVTGNQLGVAKSWYYTDVNGGGAGLVGALAGVIAAAIINAGPSSRARHQADEVAKVETPALIDNSLLSHLKTEATKAPPGPAISFQDVVLTEK